MKRAIVLLLMAISILFGPSTFALAGLDGLDDFRDSFSKVVPNGFSVGKFTDKVETALFDPLKATVLNMLTVKNSKIKGTITSATVYSKQIADGATGTGKAYQGAWYIALESSKGKDTTGNQFGNKMVDDFIKQGFDTMYSNKNYYSLLPSFVQAFHPHLTTQQAIEIVKTAVLDAQAKRYPIERSILTLSAYDTDMASIKGTELVDFSKGIDYVIYDGRKYYVSTFSDSFALVCFQTNETSNISLNTVASDEKVIASESNAMIAITKQTANMRESAKSKAKVVKQYPKGVTFEVLDTAEEGKALWYHVRESQSGTEGYMRDFLLTINTDSIAEADNTIQIPDNDTSFDSILRRAYLLENDLLLINNIPFGISKSQLEATENKNGSQLLDSGSSFVKFKNVTAAGSTRCEAYYYCDPYLVDARLDIDKHNPKATLKTHQKLHKALVKNLTAQFGEPLSKNMADMIPLGRHFADTIFFSKNESNSVWLVKLPSNNYCIISARIGVAPQADSLLGVKKGAILNSLVYLECTQDNLRTSYDIFMKYKLDHS